MLKRALVIIVVLLSFTLAGCGQSAQQEMPESGRRLVIDLNGTWDIAEGGMDSIPTVFANKTR